MVLILGAALAAAAAKFIYNRAHDTQPEKADSVVKSMRQSTSVLGAVVTAVVAVLDALQMLTRPRGMVAIGGSGGSVTPPFGSRTGGDE